MSHFTMLYKYGKRVRDFLFGEGGGGVTFIAD